MKSWLIPWLLILCCTSCITSEGFDNNNRGNFEALWSIIDEHYCFFDYKKQEYGLDWQEVHKRYSAQVHESLNKSQLFDLLSRMSYELRDGHVNLSQARNVARYTAWYETARANYYDTLEWKTLGKAQDHYLASLLKYRVLRNNIGYVRCASFDGDIGEGNIHEVLHYLGTCDGLIIDVRNNFGGKLTSASTLASAFTNQTITVGYIAHKTGPKHNDFSDLHPIRLKPMSGLRWQKNVVVLTNRKTYSAANAFTMFMKALPNVTTLGDKTGGGSGMPFSAELPNGFGVRFSASPIYDQHQQHTEFGIQPDIRVDISEDDFKRSYDTILERAIDLLHQKVSE